jgi:hypothetical protein
VAHWVWVTLFFATGFATLQLSLRAADVLVLRWVYGPERVEREQLRVVAVKPALRVSNGERLEGWSFRHFLLSLALWLPLCAGSLFVLWLVLPGEYRGVAEALAWDRLPTGRFTALLLPTVILLMCLSWSAVACGLAALAAVAVAWKNAGRPEPPPGSGLERR